MNSRTRSGTARTAKRLTVLHRPGRPRRRPFRPADPSEEFSGGFRGVAWAVVIELVAGLVCFGLWMLFRRVL